jgi:diguanylate cyclase (GGDEF)-like protein
MRLLLSHIHAFFLKMGGKFVLVFSAMLLTLFVYLDFQTRFEIAVSFFYLIPILLSAWYVGLKAGRTLAVLSITAWLVFNLLSGRVYSQEYIRYVNALVRLALFLAAVELVCELKRALQHERSQSRTDHLTGILNSRAFFNQAALEVERARRNGTPLSLAYIDLDNFKNLNDSLGHSEGDKLLQAFTETVSGLVRKVDVFARIGGDEFVLLLPNADLDGALAVARKMEQVLASRMSSAPMPVTISIGVAAFQSPPPSVDAMLQKADKLMYESKRLGKNQVTGAEFD